MKVVKYYEKDHMLWNNAGKYFTEHTPMCDNKVISNKIYTLDIPDNKSGEKIRWWINTKGYYHTLRPIITEFEQTFKDSPFGEPFRYVLCECLELRFGFWGWEYVSCRHFYAHTKQEALEKFYGLQTTDDIRALSENYPAIRQWRDEFKEKCKVFNNIVRCEEEYKSLSEELSQRPTPTISEIARSGETYGEYIEKSERLKSYGKVLDILGIKHETYQCRI